MDKKNIQNIISQMTLEEKVGMTSGLDYMHLKSIERLGIPEIEFSDGPYGLRRNDPDKLKEGIIDTRKAVCFPPAATAACSFDPDLIYEFGEALAEECIDEDIAVILGPATNIKRSPLCGRNFEYFSEDPYLAGEMSAAYINGVQKRGIGTSLKHYAVNSQEHRRYTSSSEIDERTLHEVYLPAFETAVKKAQPWTVMAAYNKVNGDFACENAYLLEDVLRKNWGFKGAVVSDWGASHDRAKGLRSGMDLQMPGYEGEPDWKMIEAVENGTLDEAVVDQAVERVLEMIFRYAENKDRGQYDRVAHSRLSRKMATESMVLLKNEGLLPLKSGKKIAFIGEFADKPRYQGGGSAGVTATFTVSALEAVKDVCDVAYSQGFVIDDEEDISLISDAVKTAEAAEIAVLFVGLSLGFESEGYDRKHMDIPCSQLKMIEEIVKVQPNIVVVLHNGAPITMPWIDNAGAVLESYLGGQEAGHAVVDLLFGKANPCGKLAETFPLKLEDNPSYLYYLGEGDRVEYREGVFVGYRYYDTKKMDVLFPFGHGFSYTHYEYSDLELSKPEMNEDETLTVRCKVKNTGKMAGKEIVQVYVSDKTKTVIRPEKELKDFCKLYLEPGEEKTAEFVLPKRAFAFYNTEIHDFDVSDGEYQILIGKSAADIVLSAPVIMNKFEKTEIKEANTDWTVTIAGDVL